MTGGTQPQEFGLSLISFVKFQSGIPADEMNIPSLAIGIISTLNPYWETDEDYSIEFDFVKGSTVQVSTRLHGPSDDSVEFNKRDLVHALHNVLDSDKFRLNMVDGGLIVSWDPIGEHYTESLLCQLSATKDSYLTYEDWKHHIGTTVNAPFPFFNHCNSKEECWE